MVRVRVRPRCPITLNKNFVWGQWGPDLPLGGGAFPPLRTGPVVPILNVNILTVYLYHTADDKVVGPFDGLSVDDAATDVASSTHALQP